MKQARLLPPPPPPPLGAALAPVAQGLLLLVPEDPQSSVLALAGVVLPLELAQASALAPQSSVVPDFEADVLGVDGFELAPHESQSFNATVVVAAGASIGRPQSSSAWVLGADLLATGVVLPRELLVDDQASAPSPQSSAGADD